MSGFGRKANNKETHPAFSATTAIKTNTADVLTPIQTSRRTHATTRARQNKAISLDR